MLLPRWLMVLSCFIIGRCYCHVAYFFATVFVVMLGDVIAWWLMECLPWVWMVDVIAKVADGLDCKYHLPHIWDEVLHKTSELKLKY